AVAESLRNPDYGAEYLPPPYRRAGNAALSGGSAGLAVFYAHLALAHPDPEVEETALRFLADAAEAVSEVSMRPALHGGYTGIAWAVTHLSGSLLDPEGPDLNAGIDAALLELLGCERWTDSYDLIGGLVGIGVYLLERLWSTPAAATAARCLAHIVRHLE